MTEKNEIVCSKCGKKHWLSETDEDGIFYKYLRCNCGYQIDLNPRGPFRVLGRV